MTKVYLIRHAEAEGNLYRRIQGHYDALVTPRGMKQIAALQDRFADIPVDACYSSDLYRTRTTATAVYPSHGLKLHTSKKLREICLGGWEDQPWGLIAEIDGDRYALFSKADDAWQVEGAETFQEVQRRMKAALTALAKKHDGQTIAVFSHGMAILNALKAITGGENFGHCDNTGVALLEYEEGTWRVVFANDNSHLASHGLSTFATQRWWRDEKEKHANPDVNLWYRPLDLNSGGDFYLDCREECWRGIYGDLNGCQAQGFLDQARLAAAADERNVWEVMRGQEPCGVLELDTQSTAGKTGSIRFLYLLPAHRGEGLGVQLIGQAISVYRSMGLKKLSLKCSPENTHARGFYDHYGFVAVGQAPGSRGNLDVLEKDIEVKRTCK